MSTPVSGADIRRTFLEFFRARGHTVVPSASLIPVDPSLLLTVAGMVPFKPYLLGEEKPPYPRATTSQKCVRTVDIDVVGTTARHMSYFEMLGNFSFGDYFKEKAIPWAYELSTEHFGMDPDRLWFTVHHSDDEAAEIWIDGVGVPADRVQRRDRDNFWQMGVAGPAGPSSEIFYDRGPAFGPEGGPVVDEERFMEFWNLVFMQYVQDEPYHVVGDLPAKSIDTGSGLERVAVLLQEAPNVFETDLVRPVVAAAEGATGARFGASPVSDVSLRILADHGRALTMMIGDGVVPSNEGRGYVLRRLLRRAVRHAWQLGAKRPVTPALVDATVEVLGDAYPALRAARDGIAEMAEREEVRFRRTLDSGHTLLGSQLEELEEGGVLEGETAFKLHDTYGFPVELVEEIASERGVTVDRNGFDREMERQRARARAARSSTAADAPAVYRQIIDGSGPTRFLGYDEIETRGTVLAIVADGETISRAAAGREVEVFFDTTTFYGESGGQVGDTGTATSETGELEIIDTQHAVPGLHGHRAVVRTGSIEVGQTAVLAVDAARRERIRKSHTGTHILHWALRSVVGPHVQQAGSLVEAGRLRFDFSHYAALDDDEVAEVERVANERVIENAGVRAYQVARQEAEELGALAFFGDKYGEVVRIVEAGTYSRELCGGTHVPTTGQIGPLIVIGESSIGSNLRRIEAYSGSSGYAYLSGLRRQLDTAASHLRTRPDQVGEAAAALVMRTRALEDRIEAFAASARSESAESLVESADVIGKGRLVVAGRDGMSPDELRQLAMQVRDRLGSGVAVIGSARDGKAGVVVVVTPDLARAGVSAASIAAAAASIVGGGASRDPELSQAGGPHGDRIGDALEEAGRIAAEALRG
ncbi:MAG: alanine--tRNA ligase [Actinobacteria bacterium RBG_16_68_21]|nr:MAG: alanine--tRNA ligase [Actinobacteria bacterium RBG_16_68_21]